jgi:hypothetical protein
VAVRHVQVVRARDVAGRALLAASVSEVDAVRAHALAFLGAAARGDERRDREEEGELDVSAAHEGEGAHATTGHGASGSSRAQVE